MRRCVHYVDLTAIALFAAAIASDTVRVTAAEQATTAAHEAYVRVSPRDTRYFELTDGGPYIPIGLNMASARGGDLALYERWFQRLSENGGNFARVWLGHSNFEVEHQRSGEYDAERAERIKTLLNLARKHNVRVKLCIESFRHLGEGRQPWAARELHRIDQGGPAKNTADFFDGRAGRDQHKRKLAWFAQEIGNDPIIFGWELWNEMDAIQRGDWHDWTKEMLPELQRLFPKNLVMQSLGSFDQERKCERYRQLCELEDNDVLQAHRYLDLGAAWEICHAPVDELAAEAVRELRVHGVRKPILLAESGAVEPSHTGPFKLYPKDTEGVILHDVLFAPFFAGAAGPGHIWHWDAYVDQNNLWHHFGRFAAVVRGLDPPAEGFEPFTIEHPRLKILGLKGRTTTLMWCRDRENTWRTELEEGKLPQTVENAVIKLPEEYRPGRASAARVYDPWSDRWQDAAIEDGGVALPSFKRSIVVRIAADAR
ncbi:MAG: hypothetical protein ACOY3P_17365 [Planctomycetota bacterium]